MTPQDYRKAVVKIDELLKEIMPLIPEKFVHDKAQIVLYLRHAGHLLHDIHMMIDMEQNPTKVFAEFTPKADSSKGLKDVSR